MIVCTYEDRPTCFVGLKLLMLSLARHCPDVRVHLFLADHSPLMYSWVSRQPNVESVLSMPSAGFSGWDVKPTILLDRFARGFSEVWWMDSDIVVTSNWSDAVRQLPASTVVIAEENALAPGHGSAVRTERLGLNVARVFQRTLCSCVMRVTCVHEPLLLRWRQTLQRSDYRREQSRGFDDRDWTLGSDQDMLAGLLGSTDFGHIPLHVLRSGRDVAHCFCGRGYRVRDRLRNMRSGLPQLVHAQGPKPWNLPGVLFAQLSPYCAAAKEYALQLEEPADWLRPRHAMARLLHGVTLGNPNLRDLPIVAWAAAIEWLSGDRGI